MLQCWGLTERCRHGRMNYGGKHPHQRGEYFYIPFRCNYLAAHGLQAFLKYKLTFQLKEEYFGKSNAAFTPFEWLPPMKSLCERVFKPVFRLYVQSAQDLTTHSKLNWINLTNQTLRFGSDVWVVYFSKHKPIINEKAITNNNYNSYSNNYYSLTPWNKQV